MVNIEFLDVMMTTSFSLRRLKAINVHQKGKIWHPRSNTHCLIVMPFGHQKSTIAKSIEDKKAVYKCDTFTEASFKGSISKDGEIVPPIMKDFGGKVVFIDEWNSISRSAQNSLLSAMENQEFSRTLGFTSRRPEEWKDNYMHIKVEDNKITDAKFKTFGCGSAIASSSLATEWIKGKTIDEAITISNSDIAEELNLPPVKIHCSVLAEDAIKAAVSDYKKRNNIS